MDFKSIAKNLLIEREGTFSKCSTQVNLKDGANLVLKMANAVRDEDLHEYGRENNPHITVLYGITPNVSAFKNTTDAIKKYPKDKINVTIGGCSKFENNKEGFEVVKFDIISDDLHELNKIITDNVDYTTDYPDYHPHMTVAYVLPGKADKYCKAFNNAMAGKKFSLDTVMFSNTDGSHTPIELEANPIDEDLGYGGGFMSGGSQGFGGMSGALGVYNSPVTKPNGRYNMMNNNTVVASGYYDTVFDDDIKKIMSVFRKLGFETEWPSNIEKPQLSVPGIRRTDQSHTMTNQSGDVSSSEDVMNNSSGLNLSSETIIKHLKTQIPDLLEKHKEADEPITFDEIMLGLKDVMSDMQYPDKDYATITVMKTLIEDPKAYSSLKKYDIHETRDIYGTKFKPNEIREILKGIK